MATYSAVSTTSSAITLVLTVTETATSTVNNTSTISWSLVLKKSASTTSSSSWKSTYSCTINGSSVLDQSTAETVTVSPGGSVTLGSGSGITVAHNSDGTKSFAVAAKIATSSSSGSYNCSISGTFDCTAIARASSITSASGVTMGSACSITWTPASSSFTYTLKFTCGSGSYTTGTISPATASAYTYTGYSFPAETWAPYITSAVSATVTATLTTYSGSTSVGTAAKTFTLTVPSSVVPTVSISVAPVTTYYSSYPYLTGVSQPKVTITSAGKYGSTISSVSTAFNGATSANKSAATFSAPGNSGSYTITTTVKDSRGRSASASTSITYTAYSSPSITGASAIRAADKGGTEDAAAGTYGYISFQYSYTSVTPATLSIQYKKSGDSSYSTATSASTSTTTAGGIKTVTKTAYFSGAALTSAYTVLITVADNVKTVTKSLTIPNAYALMYFGDSGKSVVFGGIASAEDEEYANTNDSGAVVMYGRTLSRNSYEGFYHIHPATGYKLSFGVGSGGYNRGIFDGTNGEWMLYRDDSGATILNGDTTVNGAADITGSATSGSFYVSGHSTAIGSLLTASASSVSLTAGTNKNLCSLSVPAGTWVIAGWAELANPSSTYYAGLTINSASATGAALGGNRHYYSAMVSRLNVDLIVTVSSTATYYLVGLSSVATTASSAYLRAVRIA